MSLPKNVVLLFFNEHPERFFPTTQIDVVWFSEGAGSDRFDEKIFKGPLDCITRDALSFIQTNYLKQTVIKYPDRAEAERLWNFPYAAIEEAVVNAVYHRYRNRRIGEFLKELGLTEGRSTDISKILKVIKSNGSPPPEFETDNDRSYFLIRLPVHPKGARENVPQVTPQVERLIAIVEREMTRLELMDALLLKDRMHFARDYLEPALQTGLLEMTLPDKPRSSNQRYRLTDKGRRLQEEL